MTVCRRCAPDARYRAAQVTRAGPSRPERGCCGRGQFPVCWGPLAGLTGARPDPAWLATALIDPAARVHEARSPFEGITVVPPGSRVRLRPGRPPAITPAANGPGHPPGAAL